MPLALHTVILRNAALLVPASARAEWLAEWSAELWYVDRDATAFCFGSFRDALLLRLRSFSARRIFSLDSPLRCVLSLSCLAGLTLWPAIASGSLLFPSWSVTVAGEIVQGLLWMYGLSLPFLLILNPLTLGRYPRNRYAPSFLIRLRRWLFLAVKISLLAPTVIFATSALTAVFPPATFILYFGFIFGFRWALADQKQRCPVCLHFLSNPVEVGNPANVLLQPHGTEVTCARGHGSLYMPAALTSWSMSQKWQYTNPGVRR